MRLSWTENWDFPTFRKMPASGLIQYFKCQADLVLSSLKSLHLTFQNLSSIPMLN